MIYWFYGLPSAGKTTLVKQILKHWPNDRVMHLDGDDVRKHMNYDLGFSKADRVENIRRVMGMVQILHEQGHTVFCSFVTPYTEIQEEIKVKFGTDVLMLHVKAHLNICVARDTKGLYRKAHQGIIKNMTGVQDIFQVGEPDAVINTGDYTVEESTEQFFAIRQFDDYPHLAFIGRWNPLHDGHKYIMKKKAEEMKLPLLVMVRDTDYDLPVATVRKRVIEQWLYSERLLGKVIIIPDIQGVYYGRKVGYNVEEVDVPEDIAEISGSDIREQQNL